MRISLTRIFRWILWLVFLSIIVYVFLSYLNATPVRESNDNSIDVKNKKIIQIYESYANESAQLSQRLDCSINNSMLENFNDKRLIWCIREKNLKPVQLLTEHFDSLDTWSNNAIGERPFESCPEKRCFAFRYRSNDQIPLEESDGVVIHLPNLYYFPSRNTYKRNPRQLWSLYTLESQRCAYCLEKYQISDLDDWFNLTLTVKHNFSYFSYDMKHLDKCEEYRNALREYSYNETENRLQFKKKKLAFWFVSNCDTPSRREHIVEEMLKNGMDIDIFGRCNDEKIFNNTKPDPCKDSTDKENCVVNLYNSYKFYLSFENSNCAGYITEKFFKFYTSNKIFRVDIVPVVRGARLGDYLNRAPSNYSFIFADSFESPTKLADYLLYLDRNDTAYEEYLQWKYKLVERIRQQPIDPSQYQKGFNFWPMCELCEKLHDEAYLNRKDNPVIRISEIYNPALDCSRDYENQTETELYTSLKQNCFWAKYHLPK